MHSVSLDILTSPGCTHCAHFLSFWEKEKAKWEHVVMREVSILTEEGQLLAREHSIFASPGIILNGELYSSGGYDEAEFTKKLAELSKGN